MDLRSKIPAIPFYFLRHGQTDWNREERIMGQKDIPLNELGLKQANEVAVYLKGLSLNVDRIVASPLLRARKTAEIVGHGLNLHIQFNKDLQEIGLGVLENTIKVASLTRTYLGKGIAPEGGETIADFKGRIVTALNNALDKNVTTLIIAHGGVYWALMDMMGYPNQGCDNCVPYLFTPPDGVSKLWNVERL